MSSQRCTSDSFRKKKRRHERSSKEKQERTIAICDTRFARHQASSQYSDGHMGMKFNVLRVCIPWQHLSVALLLTALARHQLATNRLARTKKIWDKPDVCTMSMKCENMRVLIVDEGCSASCESLITIELKIRTATRDAAKAYKARHGKTNQRTK